MKPALFLYPHVSSFPVLMLLGFMAGWWLARSRARLHGIDGRHVDNIALILPLAGVFGARFFAGLFYAKLPLAEALKVWEGDGLVFYGGFLFGATAVIGYAVVRRLNLVSLIDCVAPSVALGLAFGRIGCFLAGCCWGDICATGATLAQAPPEAVRQVWTFPGISPPNWPVAVQFPARSEAHKQQVKLGILDENSRRSLPVHPVQLYEAALAGALSLWLHRRYRSSGNGGSAALALLAGYAVIRFATEYLRADNKLYAFAFTFSQVVSVVILVVCAGAWLLRLAVRRRLSTRATLPARPETCPGRESTFSC